MIPGGQPGTVPAKHPEDGESMEMERTESPEVEASEADGGADENEGFGAPNVSPEEQQLYGKVVLAGMQQLYAEGAVKTIVAKLQAGGPQGLAAAMGHTVAMVLQSVYKTAKSQGAELGQEMLMQAGQELLGEVVEIAQLSGLLPDEQVDRVASQAAMEAVKAFGESELAAGGLSPEQKQATAEALQAQGVNVEQMMARAQGAAGGAQPQPQGGGGLSQMAAAGV